MSGVLVGKRILLCVSGSIAAYRAADVCSQLSKLGAEVHVVLTANAARFVGPPTFRALSRNPVLTDLFEEPHVDRIAHIDLAQSADLVLVAPASANLLAKMAHGIADDLASTCLLAVPPSTALLVAPAMNRVMWAHPATTANVAILSARGVEQIEPATGLLACQDVGVGKLADVADIVAAVTARLARKQDFAGQRLLITAGATREAIDPVRFLSNRSSGKMGFAIAGAARDRGASVTVIVGATSAPLPTGVELVSAESAAAMFAASEKRFAACDIFIAAAAVADYAPETVAPQKIKKEAGSDEERISLILRRTVDILATLAARKQGSQRVVGFAAETNDLLSNAAVKLAAKRLDLLVANDVTQPGAGFETDTNLVTLLWPDGRQQALPLLSKRQVADALFDALQLRAAP